MFNVKQAKNIVKKHLPDDNIESMIIYDGKYVFKVISDDELEGDMDPFYSVDIETGEFRDFSILTDGNTVEIVELFNKAKM